MTAEPLASPSPGLCTSCTRHRVIQNRRGSRFHLCQRSFEDTRFPKYPPLPVLVCPGYEPGEPDPEEPR